MTIFHDNYSNFSSFGRNSCWRLSRWRFWDVFSGITPERNLIFIILIIIWPGEWIRLHGNFSEYTCKFWFINGIICGWWRRSHNSEYGRKCCSWKRTFTKIYLKSIGVVISFVCLFWISDIVVYWFDLFFITVRQSLIFVIAVVYRYQLFQKTYSKELYSVKMQSKLQSARKAKDIFYNMYTLK